MNSLFVYGIIFSLASSLGYKIDPAVNLNTQKAEAISVFQNFEEKSAIPLSNRSFEFKPIEFPKDDSVILPFDNLEQINPNCIIPIKFQSRFASSPSQCDYRKTYDELNGFNIENSYLKRNDKNNEK